MLVLFIIYYGPDILGSCFTVYVRVNHMIKDSAILLTSVKRSVVTSQASVMGLPGVMLFLPSVLKLKALLLLQFQVCLIVQ